MRRLHIFFVCSWLTANVLAVQHEHATITLICAFCIVFCLFGFTRCGIFSLCPLILKQRSLFCFKWRISNVSKYLGFCMYCILSLRRNWFYTLQFFFPKLEIFFSKAKCSVWEWQSREICVYLLWMWGHKHGYSMRWSSKKVVRKHPVIIIIHNRRGGWTINISHSQPHPPLSIFSSKDISLNSYTFRCPVEHIIFTRTDHFSTFLLQVAWVPDRKWGYQIWQQYRISMRTASTLTWKFVISAMKYTYPFEICGCRKISRLNTHSFLFHLRLVEYGVSCCIAQWGKYPGEITLTFEGKRRKKHTRITFGSVT